MGCGSLIVLGILAVVLVAMFSDPTPNHSERSPSRSTQSFTEPPTSKPTPAPKPVPKQPGDQWSYSSSVDAMSNKPVRYASVRSTNTVNFDFPYSGIQRATLTLRTHPRHGKDAILQIQKGQILCPSYDGCSVLVRFDDGKSRNYKAAGAADNSSETIFINDYHGFVGKMLKSKIARVSIEIYQEGNPVFEFDVSDFSVPKYLPKK